MTFYVHLAEAAMTRTFQSVCAVCALVGIYTNSTAVAAPPNDFQPPRVTEQIEDLIKLNIRRVRAEEGRDGPVPKENEVVMSPGMKITATTPTGTITITAGKGLKRSYSWEGGTRSVEMWPRKKRWDGSLGLYFPGPGYHWKEHNGITRGVLDEGQQHFKTDAEVKAFLANRKYMPFVHRNDGLMVGWDKTLSRNQLGVEVWQIMIDGKKPTKLEGSDDDKIVVE